MYDDSDVFVVSKLPDPLSWEELCFLIKQTRSGDISARDRIALHNIRLVINIVFTRFNRIGYDRKELVSVGLIGLVNAIDTFDEEKNKAFSSYASRCIENEIYLFMKKQRAKEDSLEEAIHISKDGHEFRLGDSITSSLFDVVSYVERNEVNSVVADVVEKLNGRDREIIKLYFGFYDDRQYTQNEIALMMGMTRSNVSRLMKNALLIIGNQLKKIDILAGKFNIRSWVYNTQSKNGSGLEDVSMLKTIYGYFGDYTCEEVDMVISMLRSDEKDLLILRYGDDFMNPIDEIKLSISDADKFYGDLIPKMRKMLMGSNINKKRILSVKE